MVAFFKQNESKKYKDFQERFVFLPNTKGLSSSWGGGFSFDVNDKYYELNSDQETYTNFMYEAVLNLANQLLKGDLTVKDFLLNAMAFRAQATKEGYVKKGFGKLREYDPLNPDMFTTNMRGKYSDQVKTMVAIIKQFPANFNKNLTKIFLLKNQANSKLPEPLPSDSYDDFLSTLGTDKELPLNVYMMLDHLADIPHPEVHFS